jgi:hypothetical protein
MAAITGFGGSFGPIPLTRGPAMRKDVAVAVDEASLVGVANSTLIRAADDALSRMGLPRQR